MITTTFMPDSFQIVAFLISHSQNLDLSGAAPAAKPVEIIDISSDEDDDEDETNEPANQPANEAANQPANEAANQPANEPANQPANEPANPDVIITWAKTEMNQRVNPEVLITWPNPTNAGPTMRGHGGAGAAGGGGSNGQGVVSTGGGSTGAGGGNTDPTPSTSGAAGAGAGGSGSGSGSGAGGSGSGAGGSDGGGDGGGGEPPKRPTAEVNGTSSIKFPCESRRPFPRPLKCEESHVKPTLCARFSAGQHHGNPTKEEAEGGKGTQGEVPCHVGRDALAGPNCETSFPSVQRDSHVNAFGIYFTGGRHVAHQSGGEPDGG